jgi:cytochrome c oxidase subunit I
MSNELKKGPLQDGGDEHDDDHKVPGTVVLTLILLVTFAVYYFANWKALADVWHVR